MIGKSCLKELKGALSEIKIPRTIDCRARGRLRTVSNRENPG